MRWFLARLLYEHYTGFCILPQLRPTSSWPIWKRKDTINKPRHLPFFAKSGFCFCVYYSSGGNRQGSPRGGAVCPSHRIFFTNYAFKAEVVVRTSCVLDWEVVHLRRLRLDGTKTPEISKGCVEGEGVHEQLEDVSGKRDVTSSGDDGLVLFHLAHLRATASRPEPDFNKSSR